MRLLVCGGRTYADKLRVDQVLDKLHMLHGVTELCQGGARGADALALLWARNNHIKHVEYPANWTEHGKRAGPIRNNWMLTDFKPDLVVGFPGGPGTAHMLKIADEANVEVFTVEGSVLT